MRKIAFYLCLSFFVFTSSGCLPLIIGGAVGALGGYAISKDTLQADSDKSYDGILNSAINITKIRGMVKQVDMNKGYIEAQIDSSRVWVRLTRLTQATTRVRISARKYHLPNMELAQDLFVRIMEQAQ